MDENIKNPKTIWYCPILRDEGYDYCMWFEKAKLPEQCDFIKEDHEGEPFDNPSGNICGLTKEKCCVKFYRLTEAKPPQGTD